MYIQQRLLSWQILNEKCIVSIHFVIMLKIAIIDCVSIITSQSKVFLSCGQYSVPIHVEEAQKNSQVLLSQ